MRRSMVNRHFITKYEDYPAVQTVTAGLECLDLNKDADNWVLQVETFDPHEPFDVPESFREGYPTDYNGPVWDFPPYGAFDGSPDEVAELRADYAATLTHCDYQLGRLLDAFDEYDLWKDTSLIVTTDHGFLLGEHDLWAKNVMPCFNEVAHIPLFIFHPDHADKSAQRRNALTQTTDVMPAFLEIFDVTPPQESRGKSMLPLFTDASAATHDAILYGQHGGAINITDGRYTYSRYPVSLDDDNLNQYTLMPAHSISMFTPTEWSNATMVTGFSFTQGSRVMKVPVIPSSPFYKRHGPGALVDCGTRLFDLETDPNRFHGNRGSLSPETGRSCGCE